MKFAEIISQNRVLKEQMKDEDYYKIGILSNITIHQLKDVLEYRLRLHNVNADVTIGDYDNIVQDSEKFKIFNCVIIFWEIANLIDGLYYKAENMNLDELSMVVEKVKQEILFSLSNLQSSSLVIFNKFSTLIFDYSFIKETKLKFICNELNSFLNTLEYKNLVLVDLEKVVAKVGIEASIDNRYLYSSRALYTIDFFKDYSRHIASIPLSVLGKSKKALIFDCDNTLWKGIVGEDGLGGIKMSSKVEDGIFFEEIQRIAVSLSKQGVIVGLCSKNDFEEVQNVIDNHPDLVLKDEYIVIKKVNWENKVTNLKLIASELNIGLDSIVFIDDSDFEVNFVREQLPMVTVLQVPKRLSDYPKLLKNNCDLFFKLSLTNDDFNRVQDYKNKIKRNEEKHNFTQIEDYLESLSIELKVCENEQGDIPRIAQLTQKTNQFNLTTKRYTEVDIENFMRQGSVLSIYVDDKFGSSGLTAVVIIEYDLESLRARIDSFLMSCRIIGRNIEFSIFDYVINILKQRSIRHCEALYCPTSKNSQVENFYESCQFEVDEMSEYKRYNMAIDKYKELNISYIKVINGK